MFTRGWIGGGDAKFAAATALWLGFDHLVVYLLYASIFGGVLTLAMIRFRLMPLPQALADQEWVRRLHRLDGGVPYGIALAAAALMAIPTPPGCTPADERACACPAQRRHPHRHQWAWSERHAWCARQRVFSSRHF